ncbi:hypothetical protein FRC04_008160 [Tulasnella sp. 424]|nr:hypothetical protein FRC04_008160 [Tulasnella sp. 424]KAG8974443.1 hypothetical protein FRC05_007242 [Tulasnella sp. 425]
MLLRANLFLAVLATVSAAFKHPKPRAIAPRDDSPIDPGLLDLVSQRARDSSLKSWELGTLSEAFLEIDWPQVSVFGERGVPPPRGATGKNNVSTVLELANYAIAIRPKGTLTLFVDGAVGDPASLGVAVLLANWTQASRPDEAGNNYNTPLRQQMDYLLNGAPRTDDGAISHRSERVQLWSDFIYMAPPFIAYYGALNQPNVNQSLLTEAYTQIKLYRNYLFDDDPGLWRHITMGNFQDDGHWSTGNGWVSAGIMRVLCTINQTTAGYQPELVAAQRDLQNWATEIVNNIWTFQQDDGSLFDYADQSDSFSDSSSTALMASVTFRLASLPAILRGPQNDLDPADRPAIDSSSLASLIKLKQSSIDAAVRARDCIRSRISTNDGWLDQVVDPYAWGNQGSQSPEAQSFVLLMEAAWRGWRSYLDSTTSSSSSSSQDGPTTIAVTGTSGAKTTSTVTQEVTVTLASSGGTTVETQMPQQATTTTKHSVKTSSVASSSATVSAGGSNRGGKVCRRKVKTKHSEL